MSDQKEKSHFYTLVGQEPKSVSTLADWAAGFAHTSRKRRVVDSTKVGKKVLISTVFVGINHIFQTAIFGGPHDGYQKYSDTWAAAKAEHVSACALVEGL